MIVIPAIRVRECNPQAYGRGQRDPQTHPGKKAGGTARETARDRANGGTKERMGRSESSIPNPRSSIRVRDGEILLRYTASAKEHRSGNGEPE